MNLIVNWLNCASGHKGHLSTEVKCLRF